MKLIGNKVNNDGYVIDFGHLKKYIREICKTMNEKFICPMKSDVLKINKTPLKSSMNKTNQIEIICEDGSFFSFPENDCILLPIKHSTAEEMSQYIWNTLLLIDGFQQELIDRGVSILEIGVIEGQAQSASYRNTIHSLVAHPSSSSSSTSSSSSSSTSSSSSSTSTSGFGGTAINIPLPNGVSDLRGDIAIITKRRRV